MKICPNAPVRRCDIWLTHAERNTYRESPEFQAACRRYRGMGYRICVYVGGSEPLLPNITALLDWQNYGLF
ncbi:MAG: hypothetical protein LKK00_08020 [Intestinimonas sp.]|jgi:hypothetical protein|nr:hypothetical protein [Intestinimonas sp.]